MRKSLLILLIVLLAIIGRSNGQKNACISLFGDNDTVFLNFVDSFHNAKKAEAAMLNHSLACYVIIKVGEHGNTDSFEFIEIPGIPMPESAKSYIHNIFSSVNGKWCNTRTMDKDIPSESFLFSIYMLKGGQTIEERYGDLEGSLEFALLDLKKHKEIRNNISVLKDEKRITLVF